MAPSGKTTRPRGRIGMRWLVLLVLAAPLLVFVAVMGTRFGLWSVDVGRELLTLQIGRWLALAGLAAAVLAGVMALRDLRRLGAIAVITLLVSLATVGLYVRQQTQLSAPAPLDATSDLVDAPGYSPETSALRAALRAPDAPSACPDLTAVPTQVASEAGLRYDAVVRIRPGRTDVRVTARDDRPQGDAACRLAREIVAGLQAGR